MHALSYLLDAWSWVVHDLSFVSAFGFWFTWIEKNVMLSNQAFYDTGRATRKFLDCNINLEFGIGWLEYRFSFRIRNE